MNRLELAMAVRPLALFESHVDSPDRVLRLLDRPAPRMLVWHPDLVDWIFRSDARLRHPGGRGLKPLFGSQSLLWAEGERHATYRHVLGPALRAGGLADQQEIIADAANAAVDALAPGTEVELLAWTRSIALRVIARILLGHCDDAMLTAISAWIEKAFGARYRTLASRYLLGGLPRPGAELDRLVVRTAKANLALRPPTLVARMLDGGGPLGRIGDDELRDSVFSLIFAGHETTASATAWTLYWLDRHPAVREEIQAEVARADGSDAARVPLLHAAVLESLRLTPPATLAEHRMLPGDDAWRDLPLPAGTILTPAIYLAHHHPDVFPRPHAFDPHRFLGTRQRPQHFFPFGGGSRYCLGNQLAQLEIRMITAAVLRRREWRCANPRARPAQMRGNVLAPASRLRMRVVSCRD
jgi:cytochrome P450